MVMTISKMEIVTDFAKTLQLTTTQHITICKSAILKGLQQPSKLWVLGSNPNRITIAYSADYHVLR